MHLFRFGPRSASPFVILNLKVGFEQSDPEFPFLGQELSDYRWKPMTSVRAIVAFLELELTGQPAIEPFPILASQAIRQVLAFSQALEQVKWPPILAIVARLPVLFVTRTLQHH